MTTTWRLIIKQLRPHQWVKNLLVFLPAFTGHLIQVPETLIASTLAFVAFCFAASFVYVANDLWDLSADQAHPSKKSRPFASGNLPTAWGYRLLPSLFIGIVITSAFLPLNFFSVIVAYLLLNVAYSIYFKKNALIDIVILSLMYALRVWSGSTATGIQISGWLLAFSLLFFLSLAAVKRFTEIRKFEKLNMTSNRGYRVQDQPRVKMLGLSSAALAIIVSLFYTQGSTVIPLYTHPLYLLGCSAVLLFWIVRVWKLAAQDLVDDDPVVFAIHDKISWWCLFIMGLIIVAAL